ncbi:MAG: DUF2341 domain-containing protein [Ignavibacteriae bacterium]|nr:MAG: DUF2341 domain-containing protein [Ignavibacteriota bacterium]
MKHTFQYFHFLVFLLAFIFMGSTAYSQLAGWSAELPITIKNNSGSTMTNYQVPLVVNTQYLIGLGLLQTDGKDIRFGSDCGGSTAYGYWIEGPMNTSNTNLWVKVPSVPANDSVKIIMFFGNPSATAASTLTIFNGPHSSTDSVIPPSSNTVSSCQRGFRFSPTEALLVTHFGKRIPNATQRFVTMFDFNTQTIIKQIQVDAGTAGQYNYNALTEPFWLNSGQSYVFELFNGVNDMYYYGPPPQIGQHLTFTEMRYCNSCTQTTFPTSVLTGQQYGVPDFWYYVKENVSPAPTAIIGLPADTNTPPAPTGLIAIAGNQQIQLKWNKNTQFDIQKYFIYRFTSNTPGSAVLIDSVSHPDTMYTNTGLTNGNIYYYWVKAVDRFCVRRLSGFSTVASATPVVVPKEKEIPTVFALYQNYPNPFNPITTIKFDLPKGRLVTIRIYDLLGRELETTLNQTFPAGSHEIRFNALNLASGVYFYKIEAGDFNDMKKMVVVK